MRMNWRQKKPDIKQIWKEQKIIATENISDKKDGQFISEQYDIPREILKGKSGITVMFRAHPGNMAGPVFGLRTIRK